MDKLLYIWFKFGDSKYLIWREGLARCKLNTQASWSITLPID